MVLNIEFIQEKTLLIKQIMSKIVKGKSWESLDYIYTSYEWKLDKSMLLKRIGNNTEEIWESLNIEVEIGNKYFILGKKEIWIWVKQFTINIVDNTHLGTGVTG